MVAALLSSIYLQSGFALVPLTPDFESDTRLGMLEMMAKINFSYVARETLKGVFVRALNFQPSDKDIYYEFKNNFNVYGRVSRINENCAYIISEIYFLDKVKPERFVLNGKYCLTGMTKWASNWQVMYKLSE